MKKIWTLLFDKNVIRHSEALYVILFRQNTEEELKMHDGFITGETTGGRIC